MVDFNLQRISNQQIAESNLLTIFQTVKWSAIAVFFLALILSYAWLHNEILTLQYEMERLTQENSALVENNETLQAQHTSMIDLEKIDAVASRLGLIGSHMEAVSILDGEAPRFRQTLLAQSRGGDPSAGLQHD